MIYPKIKKTNYGSWNVDLMSTKNPAALLSVTGRSLGQCIKTAMAHMNYARWAEQMFGIAVLLLISAASYGQTHRMTMEQPVYPNPTKHDTASFMMERGFVLMKKDQYFDLHTRLQDATRKNAMLWRKYEAATDILTLISIDGSIADKRKFYEAVNKYKNLQKIVAIIFGGMN